MTDRRQIWITEVHNFGGFFGGDTITLSAVPWPEGEETTYTIDQKALANVHDRHTIGAEMLLELELSGERVDVAQLRAARDRQALSAAIGHTAPPAPLDAPRIRAYQCAHCDLWVSGAPAERADGMHCAVCDRLLT
jgi:hypothetical protein